MKLSCRATELSIQQNYVDVMPWELSDIYIEKDIPKSSSKALRLAELYFKCLRHTLQHEAEARG
jgi:hypothetical protein